MHVIRHHAVRIESQNLAITIMQTLLDEISDSLVLHPNWTCLLFVQNLFKLHKPTTMKVEHPGSLLLINFEEGIVGRSADTINLALQPEFFLLPLLQHAFGNRSRKAEGNK